MSDIEDAFIPTPDDLIVNLIDSRDLITQLLRNIPEMFAKASTKQSCLGAALKTAKALLAPVGGRVSVFQCTVPSYGEGAISRSEDPTLRYMPTLLVCVTLACLLQRLFAS